jgi:hemerythrin-like domain-containing protein
MYKNEDSRSCGGCHARPTSVLKAEHRVIERVLGALEQMLAARPIDHGLWLKLLDFLRKFTDACHHAKEEHALFPRLERAGVPREGGPIGCMLAEHAQGRALIARMADVLDQAAGGDATATQVLRETAREYLELLHQHIWKEDNVLFAMADRVLDSNEQDAMRDEFERTELSEANAGKHEHYLRVADELARSAAELAPAGAGGGRP